jgi:elongator complex protein 3
MSSKPKRKDVCREILQEILERTPDDNVDLNDVKLRFAKLHSLSWIPSNAEILSYADEDEKEEVRSTLLLKRVRSLSGVNVVAVMTEPSKCPHGRCGYCPSEPGAPASYTGYEPSTMRGIQNNFDPYKQVSSRLQQLRAIGHKVGKVELVIQGGTFLATSKSYQEHFVQRCLEAISGQTSSSLEEAIAVAEASEVRNVGITVETRPDWSGVDHVDQMLSMGVTRVELGVQNLYDDIYRLVGRCHTVSDVVQAFRICKDSGLKIVAHMMPGLPGSDRERDYSAFIRLFEDPAFKPDMLKIYPCLVLKGTEVYELWKSGMYQPYSSEEAADLIGEIKAKVPSWIRIMRVQRDIPANLIVAGVKKSNLRQLVEKRMVEMGMRCRCIRCREVGLRMLKTGWRPNPENFKIVSEEYEASNGKEIFISAVEEESDTLAGYIRLRIPSSDAHRSEIGGGDTAIVRELRVCGPMIPVGGEDRDAYQHKGLGGKLLLEAERKTVELYNRRKILVTSAIGTREYYRMLGYGREGPYMSKLLVD